MKLSRNWLKKYVPLTASPDEVTHALTFLGFEVEGVEHTGLAPTENLVVGEILARESHPGADRLSVCSVRVAPGGEPLQIVCGAHNCDVGNFVPVALVGAVLPGDFKIKRSKIRGVESFGMMCSARELNLGDDHEGLHIFKNKPAPGTPVHEALGEGDVVFDVEVTPNRPDALNHVGMARELSAWFQLPMQYPDCDVDVSTTGHSEDSRAILGGVTVHAEEACPLYTAHLVSGIKVGPSPQWMQSALTAIGLRPINNVVDVTNFVLHELGQPLHAFDARKIQGAELNIRFAREGEKLVTLDDKERALRTTDLVIADRDRPLAVAGIMGGGNSEVDESTVDLVLETAYFSPIGIRRTSKGLGLASDSSYRYERGVDVRGVIPAARRALELIIETAGGRILDTAFVVGSESPSETEVVLAPDFVRERCGFDIPDDRQREVLSRLELAVVRESEDENGRAVWTVRIPSWRGDLGRPIDLVEEILRVHGTDKIPGTRMALGSVVAADDPLAVFVRRAGIAMAGQSFVEAVNYSLRSEGELQTWASKETAATFRLDNPLAGDQSHMRCSIIPGLLDTLKFNQARGNLEGRLFETGRTFRDVDGSLYEMVSVGFVLAAPENTRLWKTREAPDFSEAKRIIQSLAELAGLNLRDQLFRPSGVGGATWQDGHSAVAGSFKEGFEARIGLINLSVTRDLAIDGPVVAGAIEILPDVLRRSRRQSRFKPFNNHPAATRDLALICDKSAAAADVQDDLTKASRKALSNAFALEDVSLFDVYEGAGLPEGRKSLAFALTFRAPDRTLTDAEVNGVFSSIQKLIEEGGYTVRR